MSEKLGRYRLGVGKPLKGAGYSDTYYVDKKQELGVDDAEWTKVENLFKVQCGVCNQTIQKKAKAMMNTSMPPGKRIRHPKCHDRERGLM